MTGEHPSVVGSGAEPFDHRNIAADELMAGFIVWLAGQRVPGLERRRVHRQAQRFLVWLAAVRHRPLSLRQAVWTYLTWLGREGATEVELLQAWAALELLLNYAGS